MHKVPWSELPHFCSRDFCRKTTAGLYSASLAAVEQSQSQMSVPHSRRGGLFWMLLCVIWTCLILEAGQNYGEICKCVWQKACQEELLSLNVLEASPLIGNPSLECEASS